MKINKILLFFLSLSLSCGANYDDLNSPDADLEEIDAEIDGEAESEDMLSFINEKFKSSGFTFSKDLIVKVQTALEEDDDESSLDEMIDELSSEEEETLMAISERREELMQKARADNSLVDEINNFKKEITIEEDREQRRELTLDLASREKDLALLREEQSTLTQEINELNSDLNKIRSKLISLENRRDFQEEDFSRSLKEFMSRVKEQSAASIDFASQYKFGKKPASLSDSDESYQSESYDDEDYDDEEEDDYDDDEDYEDEE